MSDSTKSDLEREKFEKWMRGEAIPKWPLSRDPQITDKYHNLVAQQLWEAWQARSESAPSLTRESLHAEWMAQEKFLDWSNFLLHKLTDQAPSDLRRAWEQGRDAALEFLSDRLKISMDVVQQLQAGALKWPGESATATHDNLSCAVCGKGMELVSGDPRAFYKCSSCGSDPELTAGEAGSPAPAPTEKLGICGKNNSPHLPGWYCTNWHEVEAAPAPTEEK